MNQIPSISRFSNSIYAPIISDLEHVERVLSSTVTVDKPGIAQLIKHLDNYRGKRLRPTLLLLTAQACGGVVRAHHVLGAVVEMIHTATLVHDDVLDNAVTRRHVSTVNARWGNQSSILLGDYLFTHAFHLTSTLGDAKACELIGEATNRVCAGELHQICQRGNLSLSEEEYYDIIDAKTAELTACCCRLGALYAGQSDDAVESMTRFGRFLGLSFQIADDILDLVGREDTTGKSLGTDLEQKKMTLPLIYLLNHSPERVGDEVRHIMQNGHADKRNAVLPYLRNAAAVEYAQDKAEEFATQAQQELNCLPDSDCKEILYSLTEKVVYRQT